MKRFTTTLAFAALFAGAAAHGSAQTRTPAPATLSGDMLRSIAEVEEKLTGLFDALVKKKEKVAA